jgi:hypothetical protein
MPHSSSFKTVESIGRTLPDVEVTTTWGQPTLKVRGKMFVKEHYLNYPCVLVRLSRVRADALRDLIAGAHRFVSARVRRKSSGGNRRGVAGQPRAR